MIFCPSEEVNAIWAVVAKATANNELGIAAKVALDDGSDRRKERLMCIYTKDFSDLEDVRRVITKMRDLGLVETRGRGIYYKCGMFQHAQSGPRSYTDMFCRCLHVSRPQLFQPVQYSSLSI